MRNGQQWQTPGLGGFRVTARKPPADAASKTSAAPKKPRSKPKPKPVTEQPTHDEAGNVLVRTRQL